MPEKRLYIRIRYLYKFQEDMLDIDVIMCSREADAGGSLQSAPTDVV
jgi:hypothetical protein